LLSDGIKRYAADTIKNFKEELEIHPGKPTGKKIGIIGAGPSGLVIGILSTASRS